MDIEELGDDQECGEVDGDIDDEDVADQEESLPKFKTYKEELLWRMCQNFWNIKDTEMKPYLLVPQLTGL